MDKKKKIILIISIILLSIILVIGGTVAFFGWRAEEEATIDVAVSSGAGSCTLASDNDKFLEPTTSKNNGRIIKLKASQEVGEKAYITWNLKVNNIGDLQHESFLYELVNTTTGVSYGSGNFKDITNQEGTNTIIFENSEEKLDINREYEFTLYLWIDGVNFTNPNKMAGKDLDFAMYCTITGTESDSGGGPGGGGNTGSTLVSTLTNKYLNANPTKASTANNGIYYYYAPSVGMMNDGMGSNHTWENGANTGNIRYYGSAPSNYIDIGDRDASGNIIPWRIIGVFKNMTLADGSTDTLVKIIRDQPLNEDGMQWNSTASNDWHNATLQTYLNTGEYYTGLSQSVKDKIAKVEWNLGGWDMLDVYPNLIYEKERLSGKCSTCTYNTIWEGDIALMYPSDYGYAADLTKCSKDLNNYDTDTTNCTGTDWLFNSKYQWLLTPNSSGAYLVWFVRSSGFVLNNNVINSSGVRPVLYLNSELVVESGDGTTVADAYVVQ